MELFCTRWETSAVGDEMKFDNFLVSPASRYFVVLLISDFSEMRHSILVVVQV